MNPSSDIVMYRTVLALAGGELDTSARDLASYNTADEVNGEGESSTAQLFDRCGCDDE
jgi:hypothetical protein